MELDNFEFTVKLPADTLAIEDFIRKFKEIIEENDYNPDLLYNCNKTISFYYKIIVCKTIAGKNETSALGYKKERIR